MESGREQKAAGCPTCSLSSSCLIFTAWQHWVPQANIHVFPCALESIVMKHTEAILLLVTTERIGGEKNAASRQWETKTDAVLAVWLITVSASNSPLSQSGPDALLIYVFTSRQQSLRKGKCWKILVDCVGIRACVSVCI